MFGTLKTLILGEAARAENAVREAYSVELIEQKIREAQAGLKAAKVSLAGLIQRKRREAEQVSALESRISDMEDRVRAALEAGSEKLAREGAAAIAQMETERDTRVATLSTLEARALRLEGSVEAAHRRINDLKQGALAARAVKREQSLQRRLGHTGGATTGAMEEAEELIAQVMGADDPFERSEILRDIDASLRHEDVETRLGDAGFGAKMKTTADDVLARFT